MSALDRIEHIVVLMLENRSFDNLLGKLYPVSPGFDGLTGNESNLDGQTVVKVWNSPGTAPAAMTIPTPDPGEFWSDINTQLFGQPGVAAPAPGAVDERLREELPGAGDTGPCLRGRGR